MKKIIQTLFFILVTFLISEFIFVPANLYYELEWLDIPMHILGGFLISILFIQILNLKIKNKITLFKILFFVFVVSLFWEVSEYFRGLVNYDVVSDYYDSLYDFINAFIGGVLAYLLCQKSN